MTAGPYKPVPNHAPSPGTTGSNIDELLKHKKNRAKHRTRPCGNPPAVPGNVVFTAQATEALNHLRFTGKVKFNHVSEDEQGHSTSVRKYDVQIVACDNTGVPIETEDARARLRMKYKVPPRNIPLESAVDDSANNTFLYTTRIRHGLSVGDKIWISGCNPQTAYNNTSGSPWNVDSVPSPTTFKTNDGYVPGTADCKNPGVVHDAEENTYNRLHVITEILPRPKTWYWKARVRAIDHENCAGDWSAWTTPLLPWTGSDPEPPTPTFSDPGAITFDKVNRDRHVKLRLLFTFDDMGPWDVPGGDTEDDLDHYDVQLDRSDDGTTWDGRPYRVQHVTAKRASGSADADDTAATRVAVFGSIRRRYWYRCRVRSVDRFGRRGDWSAWHSAALPFDDTRPPQPTNVKGFATATDRIVVKWEPPTVVIPTRGTVSGTSGTATLTGTNTKFTIEVDYGSDIQVGGNVYKVKKVTSDTALTLTTNLSTSPSGAKLYLVEDDPDVAWSLVQIAKAADVDLVPTPNEWNDVYAKHRTRGERVSFKIDEADQGLTFYARVRSLDAAYNRSRFVPATLAGNDDPDADGDGFTISFGGGGVVATWTHPGRARQKHYANVRWTNTTGLRQYFHKARATCGDKDLATGAPTGSGLKFNLRRWLADESTHGPVFNNGLGGDDDTRLYINANTYKDVNGPSTFDITYLDPDEALSVKVVSVGSTYPGSDWTVQCFMDPSP